MLKIYTDSNFLTQTYRTKIFPLLFDLVFKPTKALDSYYSIVSEIEAADIVVYPIHFEAFFKHKLAYLKLKSEADKYHKTIWVYTAGDFGYSINKPNLYNFRLGGFKSKLLENTFLIPSFINDPYNKLKTSFYYIEKQEQPTIGFVGHAQKSTKKYLKEFVSHVKQQLQIVLKSRKLDMQSFYPSGFKRAKYISILSKSNQIKTNFILRDKYRAGVVTLEDKEKTTLQFYNNIVNNAYTFCIRGVGNFSVRFYETLAAGRIPVLVDTDCDLPLSNIINWKKHIVIIPEYDIKNIEIYILKFHKSHTNKSFLDLQNSNRNLWLNQLERVSYFKTIHNQTIN